MAPADPIPGPGIHPSAAELLGGADPSPVDPDLLLRLDTLFFALRRILVKPATTALPIPSLGRALDLSLVMACDAVRATEATLGHLPTVKDVAHLVQVDHSTASRMLGEAEHEGLVQRGVDPDDRRRTTLSLTETGRAVTSDTAHIRAWFMGQVLSDWDAAEVQQLVDVLGRAVTSFAAKVPEVHAEAERRLGTHLPLDF
jgi:DNA-binding MarR family transcriptional regulator